jgi:hypothetical protein
MDDEDLLEYIEQESSKHGIGPDDYDYLTDFGSDRQALLDYIAIYINPEYESELYTEARWEPTLCLMYTNAKDQADCDGRQFNLDIFSD